LPATQFPLLKLPVGKVGEGQGGVHVSKPKVSNAVVGVRDHATQKAPKSMTDKQTNRRTNFSLIIVRFVYNISYCMLETLNYVRM